MRFLDTFNKIMVIDDVELDNFIFKIVGLRVLPNSYIETCISGKKAINRLQFSINEQPEYLPEFENAGDEWMGVYESINKLKIDLIYLSKISSPLQ